MQNNPEKTVGNYNEFLGVTPSGILPRGVIEIQTETQETGEQQQIVNTGIILANNKINEILGTNNKLTNNNFAFPKIKFITTDPDHPDWAGCFFPQRNEIVIIKDKIKKDSVSQTKVFIHEYIHFLSHNGRNDREQITKDSPISKNNNAGFSRYFGLDIRKGKEGEETSDYFLAFNEAVTEQLAIDILPDVHESYADYRGLLNQVIDDAAAEKIGAVDKGGVFQSWSREQIKNYIYECFFTGDLGGFTGLLQTVYEKYSISEQQFGLMTHRDDIPSVIENGWTGTHPDSPPPSPAQIRSMVQRRLDRKTPDDYITDIINSEQNEKDYGAEYDNHLRRNNIVPSRKEIIGDKEYDVDSQGYIIYRGEDASSKLNYIRAELDTLLLKFDHEEASVTSITERMNELLFTVYGMSMLSDGFRDFYIYKHTKISSL